MAGAISDRVSVRVSDLRTAEAVRRRVGRYGLRLRFQSRAAWPAPWTGTFAAPAPDRLWVADLVPDATQL